MNFFLVGPGRVGISFSTLLTKAGHNLIGCWSRSAEGCLRAEKHLPPPACSGEIPSEIGQADFFLLATAESARGEVGQLIGRSGFLRKGQILFHVIGVYPAGALDAAGEPGVHTGSLPPVQSVASIEAGLRLLPRSVFTVEGDELAVKTGRRLVEDIGGKAVHIDASSKPLYHTALSTASNFLVLLAWMSARMLHQSGMNEELSRELVLGIMKGTHSNLEEMDISNSLTGPVLRGDWDTVRLHIETMKKDFPEGLDLYRTGCRMLLEIAGKRNEAPKYKLERIALLLRDERCANDDIRR